MSDVYLWETYDKLGREALDTGDLVQANEAFRSAVATAEELQSHDRMVLSLRNLAATMMDMNQVADAHELLVRTLDVCHQNLDEEHSQTIETQRDLSHVCQQLGYLDKADELLKRVLEQELKLQDTDRVGSTLLSLAQLAQARQEPTISAEYLQRVVKLKTQKLGDDHPEVAQSLLWLSSALYQCGKSEDAEKFMRKAFGLMERQFADEPSHLAQSLLAGAKMMVDAGQLEPALVHQKRALDIFSSLPEPNDDKLWETREYIATTLAALGKLEEAIEILEYCFRNGDPQGARAGATYKNLAGLYLALGKKEEAEELYEKASDVFETTLGVEHPAYLATQEERIQLYHFSGRTRMALDVALKTIKATEKRFGAGHQSTAQAYASTALLAHGVEEWATALELMRAAEKIWMSLTPRPEDVLANCRTNVATCLIKLERYDEADPILQLAESSAGQALAPIIAELRSELETGRKQLDQAEPTSDEANISGAPVKPSTPESAPPSIILESQTSEDESLTKTAPAVKILDDDDEIFGEGDLFDPETANPEDEDYEDEDPRDLFSFDEEDEPLIEDEPVAVEPPAVALGTEVDEAPIKEEPVSAGVPEPVPDQDEVSESIELAAEAENENIDSVDDVSELVIADDADVVEPEAESLEAQAEDQAPEEVDPVDEIPAVSVGDAEEALDSAEVLATDVEESDETVSVVSEADTDSVAAEENDSLETSDENETSKKFEERRAHPRSPLAFNRFFDIEVSVDDDDTEDMKSYLVDLGLGGIRINSEEPFPKETDISLKLPKGVLGEEVDLRAEVVWQKALYGASFIQGLVFKDLSGEQKKLIRQKLRPQGSSRVNSRQHFRLYRPFPIKLQAAGQDEWQASYATDLSVNGLGTRLKAPLEQGNPIRLRLELEFELPTVEVEAKVAWSRSGENGVSHGLQFATVGPVEARTIKRYIDRCLDFLPD